MTTTTGPGERAAAHGEHPPRRAAGPAGLVVSLVLVSVVAAVGGSWTATGPDSWYRRIEQPSWNPPDWLFGPVWTVLYVAMAVAAWLVVRSHAPRARVRRALAWYAVQLALNLAWTGIFFGLEAPGWALAEIAALWLAIVATIVEFRRVRPAAAALLVPYLLWTSFAASLNAGVVALN